MPRPSRREEIRRAALECFAEKGYDGTRIADIAARSGLSVAALYNHYPSMQALAEDLYLVHFTAYAELLAGIRKLEETVEERLRRIVRVTIGLYREDRAAFTFVSLRLPSFLHTPPQDVRYPLRTVQLLVREGQKDGTVRSGDSALLASLFLGALLRPIMLAEFADAHSFRLDEVHDPVIEDACVALLRPEADEPS